MKKLTLMIVIMALLGPPAFGVLTVTLTGQGYGGANGGGEFYFTSSATGGDEPLPLYTRAGSLGNSVPSNVLGTFCVEYFEHISWGGTYYVIGTTDYAWAGGAGAEGWVDGLGPVDYLSTETKWLFEQYITGSDFGGISYGSESNLANAVQWAVWVNEQERGGYGSTGYKALAEELSAAAEAAVAAGWTTENVKVLNLRGGNDGLAQDQLVYIPSGMVVAPTPGAALLGGIGVGLVGWLRRRRSI